jgi:hypothetical protein
MLGQAPRVAFSPITYIDLAAPDPAGAVAADFNQDGHLDLLVSSRTASGTNVNMFAGDGTGSLVRDGGFNFVQATALATADFNGDGYLDAAVTQDVPNKDSSYGDTVCASMPGIALALGPAFSSPRCLVAPPRSIAVQAGDFDGDGRPEIAVASASTQGLKIYKLTFVPFLTYSTTDVAGGNIAATSMAPPIDLNGDGALDLVVGFAGGVKVFLGHGNGTFTVPAGGITGGGAAAAIDVGSINADDHPDIAWVESGITGRVIAGLGNGDGTFTRRVVGNILTLTPGLTGVAVGDIDHDGRTDIVAADNGAARIWVYFGNGDGTFVTELGLASTAKPKLLTLRDWDEDGDLDMAVLDGSIAGVNAVGWVALQSGMGPADSVAPAVSLSSPAGHGNVTGRIAIAARAADNVGVTHVDFYADGLLVARSAGPPYVVSWNTGALPNGPVGLAAWAYDSAGNATQSCVLTVIVANAPPRDTTPPLVAVPPDATIEATGPIGAVFTYAVTATDDVDGILPATCVPASGGTFAFGPTTIMCSATDAAGNTGSASFIVTVEDLSPPVVTMPSDAVLEATSAAGASHVFAVSANDMVDGSVPATCDHDSGATFPLGATPVTCTATDAHGNTASARFIVSVRDTTPPLVMPPDAFTVAATQVEGARSNITGAPAATALRVFLGGGTATDLADTVPARLAPQIRAGDVTTDVTAETLLPVGATPVLFRFRDASGNIGEAAATVTVTAAAGGVVAAADVAVRATNAEGLPQPVTASFTRVTQAGLLTALEIPPPAPAPVGTTFASAVLDVVTTALVDAPIEVCATGAAWTPQHRLQQYTAGAWVDVTTAMSPAHVCATVAALAAFVVTASENHAPAADAGAGQTVEATSAAGALVTLDGSGADGDPADILSFEWTEAATPLGTAARITVPLGVGTHALTLTVSDRAGLSATACTTVTVTDTTAAAGPRTRRRRDRGDEPERRHVYIRRSSP